MFRRIALAIALAPTLVHCGASASAVEDHGTTPPGLWAAIAPLPTARQEMPSVLLNSRIYTPGGYDAQGATTAVLEVFDLGARSWSSGPPMPSGRNHPGAGAAGGLLFLIGAYRGAHAVQIRQRSP